MSLNKLTNFDQIQNLNYQNELGNMMVPIYGPPPQIGSFNPALNGFNATGINLAGIRADEFHSTGRYVERDSLKEFFNKNKWLATGVGLVLGCIAYGIITKGKKSPKQIINTVKDLADDGVKATENQLSKAAQKTKKMQKAADKVIDEAADVKDIENTVNKVDKSLKKAQDKKIKNSKHRGRGKSPNKSVEEVPEKQGLLTRIKNKIKGITNKKEEYELIEPTIVNTKSSKSLAEHQKEIDKAINAADEAIIATNKATQSLNNKLNMKEKAKLAWINFKDTVLPSNKGLLSTKEIDAINNAKYKEVYKAPVKEIVSPGGKVVKTIQEDAIVKVSAQSKKPVKPNIIDPKAPNPPKGKVQIIDPKAPSGPSTVISPNQKEVYKAPVKEIVSPGGKVVKTIQEDTIVKVSAQSKKPIKPDIIDPKAEVPEKQGLLTRIKNKIKGITNKKKNTN